MLRKRALHSHILTANTEDLKKIFILKVL